MKRRSNLLAAEAGLATALFVVTMAFGVDVRSNQPAAQTAPDRPDEPISLIELPPTVHRVEVLPVVLRQGDLPIEVVDDVPLIFKDLFPELPDIPEHAKPGFPLPELATNQAPLVINTEPEYDEPPFVDFTEVMPELIGGLESLQESISYPEFARRAGLEGRVILQFIVNTDGSVSDAKVVRGIGGGCDEAALEAITNARFTPGLQRGRPVRVRFALPVTFRLR